jgi:hypothetical protein
MTERQRETYRSDYLNNSSGEDFVTLQTYQQSFRDAPKLSNLRMAIAPGSLKYMNSNIPQWIEIPSTIIQTEGDRVIRKKQPSSNEIDSDYMTYHKIR